MEVFEMEVLKGVYQTLATPRLRMYIELEDANLKKQGSSAIELCGFIERLGYNIYQKAQQIPFVVGQLTSPVNIYCTT